jgi:magnesium chelatase family protein
MYPCPCGFYTDPEKECTCSMSMVKRYQKKISGPLLDRIDIHVEVPRVAIEKLSDKRTGESSERVRERVEAARYIFGPTSGHLWSTWLRHFDPAR